MAISNDQLKIFSSLFKGREDVYAKRWQKDNKSGYMPAYDIDWSLFAQHRAAGGTIKDYPHKNYSKLDEDGILSHLEGQEVLGIYPLLLDNSSWFVAIDFDEGNWQNEVLKFYKQCLKHKLPAYIERSRSGNGAHVWIFFEQPILGYKSRGIIQYILKEVDLDKKENKNNSFDRIFPNQDIHSGKGLGNLVALPLQPEAIQKGNSCFIVPETYIPVPDQWEFLSSIKKVSRTMFDELLETIEEKNTSISGPTKSAFPLFKEGFRIILDNEVTVERDQLPPEVILFLRENLKISNPDFFIKKATGQNTYGTRPSSTVLNEQASQLTFPRGFIGAFLRYCKGHNFKYQFVDKREMLPEIDFEVNGSLYNYQQPVLEVVDTKDFGVIMAPPGSGKTIIGLSIIAQKKQPALIIVHRRQLFDQWVERIQSFLGIPRFKIGQITNKMVDIGEHVTIAMIQSLNNQPTIDKVEKSFGTIIIDECHHLPAESYQGTIQNLHAYYLYGLTATPIRKDKDEKLIFSQIGEIIFEIPIKDDKRKNQGVYINIRDTDLDVPFNQLTDKFETLSQILIYDSARNSLIINDIKQEINSGKNVLVLTDRKAHIDTLNQYLKQDCETIILSGDDSESAKKVKMQLIGEGRFQVLITTGQFMGEGVDIDNLNCLFLVYPCSFEGKLIQYIGRVQRGEASPIIYDYRDINIPYLEKMFQQRNKYYFKLNKAGLLKIHEEYLLNFEDDRFYIGNSINAFPIGILDVGSAIERFKKGVVWKIKILKYIEDTNTIFAEVLDYKPVPEVPGAQLSISFFAIERIKFRSIDTGGLLNSVVYKRLPDSVTIPEKELIVPIDERWQMIDKTIKVPFKKIVFGNGIVKVPFYLADIKQDIILEIANSSIRPEFEAIKDYFTKILRQKTVIVQLFLKHNSLRVLSYEANSEQIEAINEKLIESVRFEFVKKRFVKIRTSNEGRTIETFDSLVHNIGESAGELIGNETALMNEFLKIESARHFLQLKYLATRHEANILKLRFVLQPFSFLFLLAGENKYHIVWETLDSEEATYIWHIIKTKEALRATLKEIELSLSEMKKSGRNEYLKSAPVYFAKIVHDYEDAQKGFVSWKGSLEELLV